MNNLSEKDLLEKLSKFPKHELTTEKRMEMLKMIGEQRSPSRRRNINYQRIAAFAAMLTLAVIAPLLYFLNGTEENSPRSGAVIEKVNPEAEQGVYFALDNQGTPIHVDRNFGIPNKVSLLAPKEWIAYDFQGLSEIKVFLWGEELKTGQILNIEAQHQYTGEIRQQNAPLSEGVYDADAHAVVDFGFMFDMSGKWDLEFTVSDMTGNSQKKIGEFPIYVKEQYVLLGRSATLMISREDLVAGTYEDAIIEVSGENQPPEIELEIKNKDENSDVSSFTFKYVSEYTKDDGSKVSQYKGDFQVNKSGTYSFELLGFINDVIVKKPTDH